MASRNLPIHVQLNQHCDINVSYPEVILGHECVLCGLALEVPGQQREKRFAMTEPEARLQKILPVVGGGKHILDVCATVGKIYAIFLNCVMYLP